MGTQVMRPNIWLFISGLRLIWLHTHYVTLAVAKMRKMSWRLIAKFTFLLLQESRRQQSCPLLLSCGLKANAPLHLKRLCLCLLLLVSSAVQMYTLQVLKFMEGGIGWLP
uniref:Uncharacterized protein n=1 Tax=Arundo donax TaxID=35708 RepID=A0A0A9FK30_ARUDO